METTSQDYCISILREYADIPDLEWERVSAKMKPLQLSENEFYLREGSRVNRIAFIISGVFRVYCTTKSGDDKTLAFRSSGQFIAPFTPYLEDKSCWYSIQSIGPSEILYLDLDSVKQLLEDHHKCWDTIYVKYLTKLFIEKESRERSFLIEDASDRYLRFLKEYPAIEKEIHNFHIASYLGISPVTLSRIRSELKLNN